MDQHIQFDKKEHRYHRAGRDFISVTTLIGRYVPKFDKDYWSLYKAIQRSLNTEGLFHHFKQQTCGGYKNVVPFWRQNADHPVVMAHRLRVEKLVPVIIASWKAKNLKATTRGTKIHDELENFILNSPKIEFRGKIAKTSKLSPQVRLDFKGCYAYPELKLFNDQYGVAGMADLVIQLSDLIEIKDYKTNASIDTEGYPGDMMLAPLDSLPNCNFSHYTIQLSTYGWMLEQSGYKLQTLELLHIDHQDKIKTYPVPYRPDLVKLMLEDYGRQF